MDRIHIKHNCYFTKIFVLLLIFGSTLAKAETFCEDIFQKNIIKLYLELKSPNPKSINIDVGVRYQYLPSSGTIYFVVYNSQSFQHLNMYKKNTINISSTTYEVKGDLFFHKELKEGNYNLSLVFEDNNLSCTLISKPFYIGNNNSCNYAFKHRENSCITDKGIINKCINKYKQYFGNPMSSCYYQNLTCQGTSGAVGKIAVNQQNGIVHYFYQGRWFEESLSICD
jgi:hypothetical protein